MISMSHFQACQSQWNDFLFDKLLQQTPMDYVVESGGEEVTKVRQRRKTAMQDIRSKIKRSVCYRGNSQLITAKYQKKKKWQQDHKQGESMRSSQFSTEQGGKPQTLGDFEQKYQMGKTIGQGAHGVVRICIHKHTGKELVVKTIKMEDEHLPFLKTNFIHVKNLDHPSIIRYKAIYFNPKKRACYLVMERCLYPSLAKQKFDDIEEIKKVIELLFNAVYYLHSQHICHRDIKPENILYDRENMNLKIIDFGVSKHFQKRGLHEKMYTNTGTLLYRAPEMFKGCFDEKVDMWAIGVTIYKLVTRHTPFEAEYLSDTITNICNAQIDFDHDIWKQYPSILRTLVNGLLRKDPSQRLSSKEAKDHFWLKKKLEEYDSNHLMMSDYIRVEQRLKNQALAEITSSYKLRKKKSFSLVVDDKEHEVCLKDLTKLIPKMEEYDEREFELNDSDDEQ